MDCSTNDIGAFDLQGYSKRYVGFSKINRLCFIANKSPSLTLSAIIMTLDELKNGIGTEFYCQIFEKYGNILF